MKKRVPEFSTDDDAERFVDTADLEQYDLSGFKPVQFEFQAKATQLNMRLPQALLDAVKDSAKARGIPYTRFVREILEEAVASRVRSKEFTSGALSIGNFELEVESQSVLVNGKLVPLTIREYQVLELLLTRRGMVISPEAILSHLYNGMDEPEVKLIYVFIVKLRKKLSDAGASSRIGLVWGQGFILKENTSDKSKEKKHAMVLKTVQRNRLRAAH